MTREVVIFSIFTVNNFSFLDHHTIKWQKKLLITTKIPKGQLKSHIIQDKKVSEVDAVYS